MLHLPTHGDRRDLARSPGTQRPQDIFAIHQMDCKRLGPALGCSIALRHTNRGVLVKGKQDTYSLNRLTPFLR